MWYFHIIYFLLAISGSKANTEDQISEGNALPKFFFISIPNQVVYGSNFKDLNTLYNISTNSEDQIFNDEESEEILLQAKKKPQVKPTKQTTHTNLCASCACGIPNNKRIVGGTNVHTNKYPWIAQLRYYNRFYCGGSLISDGYILTAAHCTKGFDRKHITIKLMQYDQSFGKGIERNVSKIIRPESYNIQTLDNDIALLKLSSPVPMNDNIRPICLPKSTRQSYINNIGIVAGWGAKQQSGGPSLILNEVEVPIMSNEKCRRTTVYKNRITEKMLCAGYEKGEKDSCQGDSGGPLIVQNGINYQQAGIVSWGYGCAQANKPGVYTRVTKFLQWIGEHTKDSCYCKH